MLLNHQPLKALLASRAHQRLPLVQWALMMFLPALKKYTRHMHLMILQK